MSRRKKVHRSWIPKLPVIIAIATLVTTLCMLGCSEDARHTSIGDPGIHEVGIAAFSAPPRVEVAWPQLRVTLSPLAAVSSAWVKVQASRSGDMVILSGRYALAELTNVKDFDLHKLGIRDDRQAQVSIWWLDPDGRRQWLFGAQNPAMNGRRE